MDSDEVVQVYIKDMEASVRVPHHSLCGFKRIHLKSGEKKTVTFEIAPLAMTIVDDQGKRKVENGEFTLFVGGSQPDSVSERLNGKKPMQAVFSVK
jgi:beta-glucosidase